MNKNEQDMIRKIKEKSEQVPVPKALEPRQIEAKLAGKKKKVWTPARIGGLAAACLVLIVGVMVYQNYFKMEDATRDDKIACSDVTISDSTKVESAAEYKDVYAYLEKYKKDEALLPHLEESYFQAGTLGGGNHFIEIQEDEVGMACIMLHSGSRRFGNMIGQYFNQMAKRLNAKYFSSVPEEYNLSFLPTDCEEGQRYLNWMHLAMEFAFENRALMLQKVKQVFAEFVQKYTDLTPAFSDEINCHHNYASLEEHFDETVWVHRKGAIHAAEGETAIIPGAMGTNSYIVKGLGNADSFLTSSHGAGRRYSRTKAVESFSVESVMVDLKQRNVVLGKLKKSDVAEESRFAYKNIEQVMENQKDLSVPVKRLTTVGVVKG